MVEQGVPLKKRFYHLLCSHANGFYRKFAATHIEEVLEIGSQEVNDEHIMEALLAKVVNLGHANLIEESNIAR